LYAALGAHEGDTIRYAVTAPNMLEITAHVRGSPAVISLAGVFGDSPQESVDGASPLWLRKRLAKYRKLTKQHELFIAEEVLRLIPRVANRRDPMWRVARFMIDMLLWCWTADGIDVSGEAARDSLKYDCYRQFHTVEARKQWYENRGYGRGLRHEHAVPRNQLITWMLSQPQPFTCEKILEVLRRLCFAVIVTVEEDNELKSHGVKDTLPAEWKWAADGEARLMRYEVAKLLPSVRQPLTMG
jgi:hypothetical protein